MKNSMFLTLVAVLTNTLLYAESNWPKPASVKQLPATCRRIDTRKGEAVIPYVLRKVPLGNAAPYLKGGTHPNTFLQFSPDSKRLALGTMRGEIMMADVYSEKILWRKKVAEGMVKRIDFSPDGKYVYFGEQSVDGFVYGADAHSGKILWKFRLADDLGQGSPMSKDNPHDIYSKPGCYQLVTLNNGDILVLGIHSYGDWRDINKRVCLSRIYRLSPKGNVVWAFPEKEPIYYTVIFIDGDPGGKKVALLTHTEGGNKPANYHYHNATLYVLDGSTGKVTGHHTFQPLKPWYTKVGFWQSVSVGPAGERVSIGTSDGRSFLFDSKTVEPTKTFDFGTPILISDIPVSARASYTRIAADRTVYFQTSNTTVISANMSRHIVAPPGPHPNANMINAVTYDGKVAWRYRSDLSCENFWLSSNGRWMMTTAMSSKGKSNHEAGALLFDTHRKGGGSSRLVFFYPVEGRVFFHAAMAPDGSAFAIAETPFKHPVSSKLIGTYQAHIIR
jgi:hypothetical protein